MAAQRAHRRRVALTLVPVGATIQKRIRFKRTHRMRGSLRCGPASCPRALRSWRPATCGVTHLVLSALTDHWGALDSRTGWTPGSCGAAAQRENETGRGRLVMVRNTDAI